MKRLFLFLYGFIVLCFGLSLTVGQTFAEQTTNTGSSDSSNESVLLESPRSFSLYLSPKLKSTYLYTFISRDIENIDPEGYTYRYCTVRENQVKLIYKSDVEGNPSGYVLVPATDLTTEYDISAMVFENGDIYFITHFSLYDKDKIANQISNFLNKVQANSISLNNLLDNPDEYIKHRQIGTYQLGNIYLKNEGNILFYKSTKENPLVYDNLGYTAYSTVTYTSDITFEEAIEQIANAGLFYNDELIKEYKTETSVGEKYATIIYYVNEEKVLSQSVGKQDPVDDFKGCIFASGYNGYTLILDSRKSQKDVKQKYEYFINDSFECKESYDFDYKIKDGLNESESLVIGTHYGNIYRKFYFTLKCNPIRDLSDETLLIQLKYNFRNLFTNASDNKPLKILSITFGSVIAAFLTVGLVKIFSRSSKWLRK